MSEAERSGIGGVRRLLEDILTPSLGRLEERIGALTARCSDLGAAVETNREEIRGIWSYLRDTMAEVRQGMGRLEGRVENVHEEITAKVKLSLIEHFAQERRQRRFPPEDSG